MRRTIPILAALLVAGQAFCWGDGHRAVAMAIAETLGITNVEWFVRCNFVPDSFEPFDEAIIGSEAVAFLKSAGIRVRYDLHHDKGRAAAVCLLARAVAAGDERQELFWLGCLAHSTADMAACNHDPVVHLATYVWCSKIWGLASAGGLDLGCVGTLPHIEPAEWDGNLLGVMMDGAAGVEVCAANGPYIWEALRSGDDAERVRRLRILGGWAAARTAGIRRNIGRLRSAEILPELLASYESAMNEFVANRRLSDDVFTVLANPPEGKVGVVVEPSWRMNEGMFGFNDRVLGVQIANSLRGELLDVRTFTAASASKLQGVIVPASRCRAYRGISRDRFLSELKAYASAGGKVLWIGPEMPFAKIPFRQGKGILPDMLDGVAVKRPLFGEAGWSWPCATSVLSDASVVKPLLKSNEDIVGFVYPKDVPVFGFLPQAAVFPYVWTNEKPGKVLMLDSFGERILRRALEALGVRCR